VLACVWRSWCAARKGHGQRSVIAACLLAVPCCCGASAAAAAACLVEPSNQTVTFATANHVLLLHTLRPPGHILGHCRCADCCSHSCCSPVRSRSCMAQALVLTKPSSFTSSRVYSVRVMFGTCTAPGYPRDQHRSLGALDTSLQLLCSACATG